MIGTAGRITAVALASVTSLALLAGCSSSEKKAEEPAAQQTQTQQQQSSVANPLTEYASAEEVQKATGLLLKVPASATNVTFCTIDQGDGTSLIAQAMFNLDGQNVLYRMAKTDAATDISGYHFDWAGEETIEQNGFTYDAQWVEGSAVKATLFENGVTTLVGTSGAQASRETIETIMGTLTEGWNA